MHDEDWERLARYAAGEATPAEAADVERWLAADPSHRAFLRALDTVRFTTPPDLDVAAALARVNARIEGDVVPIASVRPVRRALWQRPALRAAAVVAVIVGAAALYLARDTSPPALAQAATYETAVGQADTLTLPDGSTVILAAASRLTVAAGFGREQRGVELDGVAYFTVRHDDAPFVVHARNAVITDLGTAFTVRADPSGQVRVTVTEGSVRLAPNTDPAAGVILTAGQHAALGEAPAAARADTAWLRGRLVFDDAPFAAVATELRRWYGVELVADDAALAARHLTAEFEGETVADVLQVIALALDARMEQRGDTIVFRTQ